MPHFETEQWVAGSLSDVFRFFCAPENLPVLSPPQAGAVLLRADLQPLVGPSGVVPRLAGPGSEILISVRILPPLPVRATWLARIGEVVWEEYFTDTQVRGPFKKWEHRHAFFSKDFEGRSGTVVCDEVFYEPPLGFLGAIADKLFLHKQIEEMFAHRQRALSGLFPK